MKSVFHKRFVFRLSHNRFAIFYIVENKILAGKENRTYEGEAAGRKMGIVLFDYLHEA